MVFVSRKYVQYLYLEARFSDCIKELGSVTVSRSWVQYLYLEARFSDCI